MRSLLANIVIGIVIISGIGVFYYYFKGYFTIGVGDGYYYDGWGRKLYDTPAWIQIIWKEFQFPGYKWFFIDMIGFWVYIIAASGFVKLSSLLRNEK